LSVPLRDCFFNDLLNVFLINLQPTRLPKDVGGDGTGCIKNQSFFVEAPFGNPCAVLADSCAVLGFALATSWATLATFWTMWIPFWNIFGHFGFHLALCYFVSMLMGIFIHNARPER
jgi:hypothetical protein